MDKGVDSFEAFVEVQDHPPHARPPRHAERLVLEAFQDAADRVEDAQLQNVLRLTCALYALEHVERDRGWFLEQNLFRRPGLEGPSATRSTRSWAASARSPSNSSTRSGSRMSCWARRSGRGGCRSTPSRPAPCASPI